MGKEKQARVIIQLQGGLVQDVFVVGNRSLKSYVVVDHDTEGSDDYITVSDEDGGGEANVSSRRISGLPRSSFVAKIVKIFDSRKG